MLFSFQYLESSQPVNTVRDKISNYLANSESEQTYQLNKCLDDALCKNSAIMKRFGASNTITDNKLHANLSIIQSNECSDNQICINDAEISDHPFLSKESKNIIQHCDTSSGPTCLNNNNMRVDTDALSKAMRDYAEEPSSDKSTK